MHNFFRGDALRYDNREVKQITKIFDEAYKLMREQFCSEDVQSRIKSQLLTLNFEEFVEQEWSASKGLSKMTEFISRNIHKCPLTFQSEDTKIDILKKALLPYSWAEFPLSKINPTKIFRALCNELSRTLLFEEEKGQNPITNSKKRIESSSTKNTGKPESFVTQRRYAKEIAGK